MRRRKGDLEKEEIGIGVANRRKKEREGVKREMKEEERVREEKAERRERQEEIG